jgi:hypothetical protein
MESVTDRTQSVSLSEFDLTKEKEHRAKHREEIKAEIDCRDAQITKAFGRVCPNCKAKLYAHSKTHAKEVWTRAGMITMGLRRLRCTGCKHLFTPASHLTKDGLLSSLAEIFIEYCTVLTFSQAAHLLNVSYGLDIPVMTLHAYVRAQLQYFDDKIAKETENLFETGEAPERERELKPGRPLYLCIDEGLVREWKCRHSSDTPTEKKTFVTAYTAVFFEGRKCLSSSKVAYEKRRYALTSRYGHASAAVSIDQFFKELVCLSYKRGRSSSTPLIILTDGAKYLTSAVKHYFPKALLLLDMYHLRSRIEEVIDPESDYCRLIDHALHRYDPSALYRLVSRYPCSDEKAQTRKEKLLGYIHRNATGIAAHRDRRTNVHASSAAEKAVDLLIGRRFKRRGMSWTEPGTEVLLYFRCLAYNKRSRTYWKARHAQPESGGSLQAQAIIDTSTAQKKGAQRQAATDSSYYHQVHLIDCEKTAGINLN